MISSDNLCYYRLIDEHSLERSVLRRVGFRPRVCYRSCPSDHPDYLNFSGFVVRRKMFVPVPEMVAFVNEKVDQAEFMNEKYFRLSSVGMIALNVKATRIYRGSIIPSTNEVYLTALSSQLLDPSWVKRCSKKDYLIQQTVFGGRR